MKIKDELNAYQDELRGSIVDAAIKFEEETGIKINSLSLVKIITETREGEIVGYDIDVTYAKIFDL